jgi:hypothetical protein
MKWSVRRLNFAYRVAGIRNNSNYPFFVFFYLFLLWPTDAQLIEKLSHSSYIFRHFCVILREFVVGTLPSYTSMSNAVVGNII